MASKKKHRKDLSLEDYQKVYERIGKELKRLRLAAGYTSSLDFAYENDLSHSQYGRYEKGSNMKLDSLITVVSKHGLTLEDFFKGFS